MNENLENFIIANSPDGGFLQSDYWKKFQESVGRKTHMITITDGDELVANANIIMHKLPVVGDYFYIPRGPIVKAQSPKPKVQSFLAESIKLVRENSAGWIRVEPNSEEDLNLIKENLPGGLKTKKSSVDMQPREILIVDISKSEEEILAGMKQKTRYNIRLAQKRGISVKVISNFQFPISKKYVEDFLRLVKVTSTRDKITSHPENYYRKMFETIPPEMLKLYIAEYEGKIIAANLVLFFGKTATYMHGASDNEHRDTMAPYLLQWQAVKDARKRGCVNYDLGGINTQYSIHNTQDKKWAGITRFKTGFAPEIKPIEFPGCWDIVINPGRYNLYRIIQKGKKVFI